MRQQTGQAGLAAATRLQWTHWGRITGVVNELSSFTIHTVAQKHAAADGTVLVNDDGSGVHTAQEKTFVHHHDQIGNTVVVTDEQKRDVLWVQYDVYGAVVHAESPVQRDGGPPVKPELNEVPDKLDRALAVTPHLFSGQQGVMTDPNGLLYMRARYFHPGLRRFVNPDPIGFEGGNNWYAYAGGNPLMANDPSGLAVRNAGRNIGHAFNRGARFVGHHVLGKAWNSPNTAIGLVWGIVGLIAETVKFPFTGDWDFRISFAHNAIQFEGHEIMTTAVTFGNTISYAGSQNDPAYSPALDQATYGVLLYNGETWQHEMQHTYQGEQLGPLYLPSNVLGMIMGELGGGGHHGPWNWNERGPQSAIPQIWNSSRSYPY